MEKHDKFAFIKLFTGASFVPDFNPNICISTAAANTGIDKATMEMVVRMGIPRDVVTSFQERGRNAREEGINSAMTSPRSSKRQRLSDVALTSTEQRNNRATAYADHVDCINLYCLPELGCVHARSEWIMHCGDMQQPPPSIAPCGTQCTHHFQRSLGFHEELCFWSSVGSRNQSGQLQCFRRLVIVRRKHVQERLWIEESKDISSDGILSTVDRSAVNRI